MKKPHPIYLEDMRIRYHRIRKPLLPRILRWTLFLALVATFIWAAFQRTY